MSQTWRALEQAVPRAVADLFMTGIIAEMQVKGIDCTWEKASPCPCYQIGTLEGSTVPSAATTMPRPNCPACAGDGWIYHGSQSGRFLLTSATSSGQTQGAQGYVEPGTFSVTALVEQPLGQFDRVTVNSSVRTVEHTFKRGSGSTDTLRFPIVNKTWVIGSALDPTIPQTVTLGVEYLVAASPTTGEIIGGATPTEYVQGVNFTVSNGIIDWTIGGANVPPTGARCSIRYFARPRYIVTAMTFSHRQLGFNEFAPTRYEKQLLWRGQAVLESLGTAPT